MSHHDDLCQAPWEVMENDIYTMVLSTPTSGPRRSSIKSAEDLSSGPSENSSFSGESSVCHWSPSTPHDIVPMDYKMSMQQYNMPFTPMSKFGPVLPGQYVSSNFDYNQSYEPKRLLSDVHGNRNDNTHSNFSFAHNHDATAFNHSSYSDMASLPTHNHLRSCNPIESTWLQHQDSSTQLRDNRLAEAHSAHASFEHTESPGRWSNYTSSSADTVNPWHVGGIAKHHRSSDYHLSGSSSPTQAGQSESPNRDTEYNFVEPGMAYAAKHGASKIAKSKTPGRTRRKLSQSKLIPSVNCPVSETGTNDYKCDKCSRPFRRREHLKRHQKTAHSEVKPYNCAVGRHGGEFCKIINQTEDRASGKRRTAGISRSDNQIQHYKTHLKNGRNTCVGRDMVYWLIRRHEPADRVEKIIASLEETWHSPDFKRGKVNEEKIKEHKEYAAFIADTQRQSF